MSRELKDYIHLYIGQMAQTPTRHYSSDGGKSIKMCGRIMDIDIVINQVGIHFEGNNPCDLEQYPFDTLKLILRPLEEMSDTEAIELCELVTDPGRHGDIELMGAVTDRHIWYIDGSRDQGDGFDEVRDLYVYFDEMKPEQIRYCLSKGFDLFGLRDAGLAVYEIEIKK